MTRAPYQILQYAPFPINTVYSIQSPSLPRAYPGQYVLNQLINISNYSQYVSWLLYVLYTIHNMMFIHVSLINNQGQYLMGPQDTIMVYGTQISWGRNKPNQIQLGKYACILWYQNNKNEEENTVWSDTISITCYWSPEVEAENVAAEQKRVYSYICGHQSSVQEQGIWKMTHQW